MFDGLKTAVSNRYLWDDANLVVVLIEAKPLWETLREYRSYYHLPELPAEQALALDQALAVAAMANVSLAEKESWGWSLALPGLPFGLFIGAEPEGMVIGRVMPRTRDEAKAAVQRRKKDKDATQSYYEPLSADVFQAMEGYFDHSEQVPTRLFVNEDGRGALVRMMPQGDFDRVANLPGPELVDQLFALRDDETLRRLEEFRSFTQCLCTDEYILNMITSLPQAHRQALWGDEPKLEIECPRCGRMYVLRRQGQGNPTPAN